MEIPAIFLLNKLFPLYGLAYAQAVTEVILAATAVLVLGECCGNPARRMPVRPHHRKGDLGLGGVYV